MPVVFLDANLLLLLLIGSFDPRLLLTYKSVSQFSTKDYALLRDFVQDAVLVTTPHILTEVSNLGTSLPERTRCDWLRFFAAHAERLQEVHTPFRQIALSAPFSLFGLADAALAYAAGGTVVFTEDGRIRAFLAQSGLQTLSMDDLRAQQIAANEGV